MKALILYKKDATLLDLMAYVTAIIANLLQKVVVIKRSCKYLNFQKALGLTYNVLEFENRPEFQYSKNNLLVFETKILVVKYLQLRIFLDKNQNCFHFSWTEI